MIETYVIGRERGNPFEAADLRELARSLSLETGMKVTIRQSISKQRGGDIEAEELEFTITSL